MLFNDVENKVTRDTQSGAELRLKTFHARSHYYVFELKIRESILSIITEKDKKINEGKILYIKYLITDIRIIKGSSKYLNSEIIIKLLSKFQDYYGYRDDLNEGVVVEIDFSKNISALWEKWEAENE